MCVRDLQDAPYSLPRRSCYSYEPTGQGIQVTTKKKERCNDNSIIKIVGTGGCCYCNWQFYHNSMDILCIQTKQLQKKSSKYNRFNQNKCIISVVFTVTKYSNLSGTSFIMTCLRYSISHCNPQAIKNKMLCITSKLNQPLILRRLKIVLKWVNLVLKLSSKF